MKEKLKKHKKVIMRGLQGAATLLLVFVSNYYLQLSQNKFSWNLATKFAFSWHTEKFLLGCFALFSLLLFIISLIG